MEQQVQIENLSQDYCNDFVCTSSPAIEQTVRSLARDIERQKVTTSLFQKDAKWSDGFRSCQGSGSIPQNTWPAACLTQPKATVQRLQMLDKGTAQINWRLTGALAGLQLDISFVTVVTLNLVTGRVEEHKLTWDLSKCSPPAAAITSLQRSLWSAQQSLAAGSSALGSRAKGIMDSMDGFDSNAPIYQNPTDPTRFFQQKGGDPRQNDYIAFAFLLALLYFATKLYGELVTLG